MKLRHKCWKKKKTTKKKPQTNKKKGFIRQAIGHRWEYILPSVSYMQENTYAVKSYSSFLSCILSQIQWDILTPSWKIWQLPPSSEPYPSDNLFEIQELRTSLRPLNKGFSRALRKRCRHFPTHCLPPAEMYLQSFPKPSGLFWWN